MDQSTGAASGNQNPNATETAAEIISPPCIPVVGAVVPIMDDLEKLNSQSNATRAGEGNMRQNVTAIPSRSSNSTQKGAVKVGIQKRSNNNTTASLLDNSNKDNSNSTKNHNVY